MRNPVQEYSLARSMPIKALAAVLQGTSDMVSLIAAHTVLREKMEAVVAEKGMQAMQSAQAPKIKDKDLAMAQGLGASPADIDVPMGGIVGGEGTFGTGAAGGGSVVAFQTGGLGALNMSGNELKNFIDAMTKKGVPPAQVNQIAQQAQAVAANNPGALRGFLKTAASRFGLGLSGGAGAMMGFTDALVASEKGGRPVTGATPGYNYPAEEMISGVEPGVVGPSTNKSSLDQLFSNIGAIMPSGLGAETRQADEIVKARARAAAAGYGQADTGGVPTQTLAGLEAVKAEIDKEKEDKAEAAGAGGVNIQGQGPGGIAQTFEQMMQTSKKLAGQFMSDAEPTKKASDVMADYNATLKEAGYDFNLLSKQMGDVAKEKEELKGNKTEAVNLRLLEAGLGILGGESPYAFVNIGKGATPALQGLAKDIKEIQKRRKEYDKETRQLQMMQNQMAEGRGKYTFDTLEKQKAEQRRAKEREEAAKLDMFKSLWSNQTSLQVARIGAAREGETSREISKMPGKTRMEQVQNYAKAITKKTDPAEAAYVKTLETFATEDPGGRKLEKLKESNPALYARIKQDLATFGLRTGMITEKPDSVQFVTNKVD
jgi:hypothetical protein